MMDEGRGCCGTQRRKESIPPGQIKEDFTEEVTFKPGLKGLVGLCQVGTRRVEQRPKSMFRDRK